MGIEHRALLVIGWRLDADDLARIAVAVRAHKPGCAEWSDEECAGYARPIMDGWIIDWSAERYGEPCSYHISAVRPDAELDADALIDVLPTFRAQGAALAERLGIPFRGITVRAVHRSC